MTMTREQMQAIALANARKRQAEAVPLVESLPEIGEAPELNQLSMQAARASLAASLITNEEELGQALQAQIPDAKIIKDAEGRLIADLPSGQFAINKPGLSGQDFAQFVTRALLFTPAGRGLQGIAAPTLARAAGQAAATEAGIQAAEAGLGGEITGQEVALAGGLAPVGQVVGEAVLSPLARAVGGRVDEGMKSLIQKAKDQNIDILTTDVVPPDSFMGRTMQQLGEKLGFIGTGGRRATQQRARIEIVEGLAQEMGVTLDQPIEADIFKSLSKGVSNQLKQAGQIRNEAVDVLDGFGVVNVSKANKAIDTQIARQVRLREDADQQIIGRLESLKRSLEGSDFSLVKDLRSNLIDDVSAAYKGDVLPTKAVAPLQAVKSAIDEDMLKFAKANDRDAAAKWVQSNRIFADGYKKAKDTEIKRLLNKGEGTPELIANVIKAGKPSELNRMNSLLDESGRKAAQLSIIRDALTESGFFTAGANPDRFATAISKPARQKAVNVFFKGKQKDQIEGIQRVLNATRRAQEAPVSTATGQQLAAPVAAIAGAQFDAGVSFGTATALGAMTRAYESKAARTLLIRLANAPKGSQAERKILDQVMPFFMGAIQSSRPELEVTE